MAKRRRVFYLLDIEMQRLAEGVLYDEGNVQILWRHDIGYTAEQYHSIRLVLDLFPNIIYLKMGGLC